MSKYVLAFLGLALLLSACRIESNILLDINEDGSATIGAEVGFDEEMLNLVTQGGGDPGDILGDLPDLGGSGAEPIERIEGDMTFFGVQTTVEDLSTYDFDGLQGETFSEFSYEFNDASATLAATVDATGVGDLGGDDFPIDPSEITGDIFSAKVIVTMPGNVTEHNADEERSDGALVWNLPLVGTKDIFATSSFGGSGVNWIWFVVGGILLVGVIAAVAAIMASRKDSERAVAEAAAAHEAQEQPSEEEPSAISHQPSAEEESETTDDEPKVTVELEISDDDPDADGSVN